MTHAHMFAVSSVLGEKEVSTSQLLEEAGFEKLGYPTDYIQTELKISHVRRSEVGVKPSDLAIEAGRRALNKFPGSPHDIDAIFFCGIERDSSEPGTSHSVNDQLGTNASIVVDLSDACHGFAQGINIAKNFIENGSIKFALVVTGERSSIRSDQIRNYFLEGKLGRGDIKDTLGVFTLGDSGGAMILGACGDESGIQDLSTFTNSRWAHLCKFQNFAAELGVEPEFCMSMQKICATTIKLVKDKWPDVASKTGWDEHDWLVPHQVGELPFMKYLDIFGTPPQKSIATYPRLGNLASATLPVALDRLESDGNLTSGDRILLVSSGSGIVISFISMIY